MNERIKELLIEAGVYECDVNDPEFVVSEEQKKFAELIVRECMSCCDVVEKIEWIEPPTYELAVTACKVKIQKYFGVEE